MNEMWAIVELMGHVKVAGLVTEEEKFGAKIGRIDIPMPDGTFTTQWFGGGSVYRITPVTEEVARAASVQNIPRPVSEWDVRQLMKPAAVDSCPEGDQFHDDDDSDLEE